MGGGAAIAPCARLGEGGNDDDTRMVESRGDSVGGLRKGVVRDGRGVSTSSSLLLGFSLKLRSWATNSNVPGPDVDDAASL